jgi:hypothetical protein
MRRVWWWLIGGAAVVVLMAAVSQYDWRQETQPQDPTGPRYDQRAGESEAGKRETAADAPREEARAQDITQSAQPLRLSDEQRERIRAALGGSREARVDNVDFGLSLGSAVPRQVQLHDLPVELADIIGGYHGSKYLIVRDQLVIVDAEARRIVAIIPNMG